MAKKKYYAVKKGLTPGIYETWAECEANVKGFPGAEYKGFATLMEAEEYYGGSAKPKQLSIGDVRGTLTNDVPINGHILSEDYIGQDEVGRAEPFRRIIVVSAYLDGSHNDKLKRIGALRDSKSYGIDTDKCVLLGRELTHFKSFKEVNNEVYENEKLGITYSVYSISNGYYNELRAQDKRMNGNKILAIMHNRAGYKLCSYLAKKDIIIKDVVIDNFMSKSNAATNYALYTTNEKYKLDTSGVRMIYEAKAENKYPAVAVAANIASYIETLYESDVRESFKSKGGDLYQHGFSNGTDDVQYAFDEIVKVYGSLDSEDIEEEFKHSAYYDNYIKTGCVAGNNS